MLKKKVLKILSVAFISMGMFAGMGLNAYAGTNVTISPAIVSTMEKKIDFKLENTTDEKSVVSWSAELLSDSPDYLKYITLEKKSGKIKPNETATIPVKIAGGYDHIEMPVKLRVAVDIDNAKDGNIAVNRFFEIPIYHKSKDADKVPLNYTLSKPALHGNIQEVSKGHLLDLILFNSEAWKLQKEGNMVKDNVYDIKSYDNIAFGSKIDNKTEVSFEFESKSTLGIDGVNPILDVTGVKQVASPKSESSIIYGIPQNALEAIVSSNSTYTGKVVVNAKESKEETSTLTFKKFRSKYIIAFLMFYTLVTVLVITAIVLWRKHRKKVKEDYEKEVIEESNFQDKLEPQVEEVQVEEEPKVEEVQVEEESKVEEPLVESQVEVEPLVEEEHKVEEVSQVEEEVVKEEPLEKEDENPKE